MFSFLRRFSSQSASRDRRDERQNRQDHGLLVSVLECDVNNIERLTRALGTSRR